MEKELEIGDWVEYIGKDTEFKGVVGVVNEVVDAYGDCYYRVILHMGGNGKEILCRQLHLRYVGNPAKVKAGDTMVNIEVIPHGENPTIEIPKGTLCKVINKVSDTLNVWVEFENFPIQIQTSLAYLVKQQQPTLDQVSEESTDFGKAAPQLKDTTEEIHIGDKVEIRSQRLNSGGTVVHKLSNTYTIQDEDGCYVEAYRSELTVASAPTPVPNEEERLKEVLAKVYRMVHGDETTELPALAQEYKAHYLNDIRETLNRWRTNTIRVENEKGELRNEVAKLKAHVLDEAFAELRESLSLPPKQEAQQPSEEVQQLRKELSQTKEELKEAVEAQGRIQTQLNAAYRIIEWGLSGFADLSYIKSTYLNWKEGKKRVWAHVIVQRVDKVYLSMRGMYNELQTQHTTLEQQNIDSKSVQVTSASTPTDPTENPQPDAQEGN